eukprot:TRINITY_DN7275_c0_g1_i2.p1 TRINITY_DN7275_c0_g1~~TRINITY_DN7275_c0_g1_i2.p1  ORF type:complete len:103 (-),score=9.26 TRINITY_DN7275_c0_g1_i2:148-456(-)
MTSFLRDFASCGSVRRRRTRNKRHRDRLGIPQILKLPPAESDQVLDALNFAPFDVRLVLEAGAYVVDELRPGVGRLLPDLAQKLPVQRQHLFLKARQSLRHS